MPEAEDVDREAVNPRLGTHTDRLFHPEYPVWLGADKKLSANPLPLPGKVQVSGPRADRRAGRERACASASTPAAASASR